MRATTEKSESPVLGSVLPALGSCGVGSGAPTIVNVALLSPVQVQRPVMVTVGAALAVDCAGLMLLA